MTKNMNNNMKKSSTNPSSRQYQDESYHAGPSGCELFNMGKLAARPPSATYGNEPANFQTKTYHGHRMAAGGRINRQSRPVYEQGLGYHQGPSSDQRIQSLGLEHSSALLSNKQGVGHTPMVRSLINVHQRFIYNDADNLRTSFFNTASDRRAGSDPPVGDYATERYNYCGFYSIGTENSVGEIHSIRAADHQSQQFHEYSAAVSVPDQVKSQFEHRDNVPMIESPSMKAKQYGSKSQVLNKGHALPGQYTQVTRQARIPQYFPNTFGKYISDFMHVNVSQVTLIAQQQDNPEQQQTPLPQITSDTQQQNDHGSQKTTTNNLPPNISLELKPNIEDSGTGGKCDAEESRSSTTSENALNFGQVDEEELAWGTRLSDEYDALTVRLSPLLNMRTSSPDLADATPFLDLESLAIAEKLNLL